MNTIFLKEINTKKERECLSDLLTIPLLEKVRELLISV